MRDRPPVIAFTFVISANDVHSCAPAVSSRVVFWRKEGAFVAVWPSVPQSVSLSNQERDCGPSTLDETRLLALDLPSDYNQRVSSELVNKSGLK